MSMREIIEIDESKCDGCGLCVPGCAEGAIQIIDGKAKLVSDIYCDGLGACIGHCPQNALKVVKREAEAFDEEAVEELLKSQGKTFKPQEQSQTPHNNPQGHGHGHGGCPGSRMMKFEEETNDTQATVNNGDIEIKIKPQLRQWPVQLNLVPVNAPYFENADLLVTADCVPFAYPNYHLDLLKGKAVVIGCPKLDDLEHYTEKLTNIIASNNLKSITVAFMEVPCCGGIVRAVDEAVIKSSKNIVVNKVKIGIQGQKK
ncbi:4Fe-4S binding protein [Serpentinicella sp. ANB-PHB4]|uniref:ATP-binding protein n=1 Tax=Serpentinicella sp. ANB-PHB4 TaxID=3074076 RepID=UPI00285D1842|nr:4Fe-4S binding protein [Serpentinicella sp. ANB-PHB4]MDR5659412.1 4Fe-4S binding protein [Serpentinicella sp. ANB-PHB4]